MHPRSEESSDLRKANEKLQVGFGMIWWAKTEKKLTGRPHLGSIKQGKRMESNGNHRETNGI